MNICCLQHVPYEGLGCIGEWINEKGHQLKTIQLYNNDKLPAPADFDMLIVMGGPMGVYDEEKYTWLVKEKQLIEQSIRGNKIILGICLGAQLIASVMGVKVFPNKEKEIGWYPVNFNSSFEEYLGVKINPKLNVFHWHGDTFSIPDDGILHASSLNCINQLFSLGDKIMAIQFHLEATPESIKAIVENCSDELAAGGNVVQTAEQILSTTEYIAEANLLMFQILDKLSEFEKA